MGQVSWESAVCLHKVQSGHDPCARAILMIRLQCTVQNCITLCRSIIMKICFMFSDIFKRCTRSSFRLVPFWWAQLTFWLRLHFWTKFYFALKNSLDVFSWIMPAKFDLSSPLIALMTSKTWLKYKINSDEKGKYHIYLNLPWNNCDS